MIEINLLPPEHRRKERRKLALPSDLPAGKVVLVTLGALFALQLVASAYGFFQSARLKRVEAEIARLKTENADVTLQKAEIDAMKARIREVDLLSERKFAWTALLNAFSDAISKGIWLTSFYVADGEAPQSVGGETDGANAERMRYLRIEGSAVGQGDETANIGKFIQSLKENAVISELIEDVRLININQKKIREFDVYDFLLVCIFKKAVQ